MADDEDLEQNPFFNTLKGKFSRTWKEAQQACCLVVVPSAAALHPNSPITLPVIEAHIYKPSRMFKNNFDSFYAKVERKIEVDSGTVTCLEGFQHGGKAIILFEELYYNKKGSPFQVLCVDRVLDQPNQRGGPRHLIIESVCTRLLKTGGVLESESGDGVGKHDAHDPQQMATYRETVLESNLRVLLFEETRLLESEVGPQGMEAVKNEMGEFMAGYMIVDGYLDDVQEKFTAIRSRLLDDFADLGVDVNNPRINAAVGEAVECHVMQVFYDKVFPVIKTDLATNCTQWKEACAKCQDVTPADMGIRPEFGCDLASAVQKFSAIVGKRTPIEMHWCLKVTMQKIATLVELHLQKQKTKSIAIATDDLIPLLAQVLIKARIADLPCCVSYMGRFAEVVEDIDEFGFNSVTLQAAMDFVVSTSKSVPRAKNINVNQWTWTEVPRVGAVSTSPTNNHPQQQQQQQQNQQQQHQHQQQHDQHHHHQQQGHRKSSTRDVFRDQPLFATPDLPKLGSRTRFVVPDDLSQVTKDNTQQSDKDGKPVVVGKDATATVEDMGGFLSSLALGF